MNGYRSIASLLLSATLLLVAAPVFAQEESADESAGTEVPSVDVSGIDYAFVGLPDDVPAGTALTFRNDGTEYHEMIVVKINDETTSLEELMAMPEEESAQISEFIGYLATFPGTAAEGSVTVAAPGRYIATCVIHQGSDPAAFEALDFDPSQLDENTDPSTLPEEVQELLATIDANPQHMELGMIQEFEVASEA